MLKSENSKCLNGNSGGIDRISHLPDHLISRILSLLPTKCAVGTSVLSTRWRFQWSSITNLDFDNGHARWCCSNQALTEKRNNFIHFVSRVLLQLNPPSIQNFRLKCKRERFDPFDPSDINSWISVAFARTVRELDLYLSLEKPTKLPLTHISCNVVVLKLKGMIHFSIPEAASVCFPNLQTLHLYKIELAIASNSSISFPNLKVLHLNHVHYANEDSVHKLFSSCPVLDDLVIERGFWDNVLRLIIRIPTLTRLSFIIYFEGWWNHDCKLQLDTPALQYLNLEDFLPCEYLPMENFDSLLQANVKFVLNNKVGDNVESCISIIKFLGNLSNVKFLSIAGDAWKVFCTASANILPRFNNLTRLELETPRCSDSSIVINNLLRSMDNLEHLVVNGCWMCSSSQSWWTEPPYVPKCLLSRVTTISFNYGNVDCRDQLQLLRYFLKNAQVLQLLTISTANPELKDSFSSKFLKKIPMLPRGSWTCQVAIN